MKVSPDQNPPIPGPPGWHPAPGSTRPPASGGGFSGFEAFPNASPGGLRDPVLSGRFGAGIVANRTTLRGRVPLSVTVDRPSIVYPVGIALGAIYYQTQLRPPWQGLGSTAPPNATMVPAFQGYRSTGNGVCLLPTVGEWWLYYDVSTAAALEVLVIPAEDPSVAARYLAEPGCHTAVNTNLTGAGSAVGTIAANKDRRAFFLQNLTGSSYLRLGMGTAVTGASVGTPPAGNGYALAPLGVFQFQGDSCYKGAITVISDVAWEVEYTEFT